MHFSGDELLQRVQTLVTVPYCTYRGACDSQFQLSSLSTYQCAELLTHALEQAQSVIFAQSLQEILDRPTLVGTSGVFLQLCNDLGLVGV